MTKITIAVIFALSLMLTANWFAGFVFRDAYSPQLAVDIPDYDEAPLVNRADLQRSWPQGLGALTTRGQVRAHMTEVENLEPPKRVAALADTGAPPPPEPDFATLLANADVATGERRAGLCAACHSFDNGGRDGLGPNLWGVVGSDIAASATYDYSDALIAEPGDWSYEKLNAYLASPATAIPGNKMAFAGIRRASDRAAVIAYLRMQGASQIPLPEPAPVEGDGGP